MDVPVHLEHSLDERCRKYRKAFDRCRRKFSEDSVHQLRVETRRLLALLDLLDRLVSGKEHDALRRLLKALFDSSASLRDTQVQWLFVQKHRRRFPEAELLSDVLTRRKNRLVKKLKKKLHRSGEKETKKLASALRGKFDGALLEAGLRARGPAIILRHADATFARVVGLRRRIDPARAETIHRTRVAFKKFRYLVELLQPLLPGVSRRKLKVMHDYQNLMGEIQDLEILQETLDKYVGKKAELVPSLQSFRQEIERQHAALVARYLGRADQLLEFWPVPALKSARLRDGNLIARSSVADGLPTQSLEEASS
jgi:CHAD domain-containing protein